jgi:lysophospholipase L1-like esterase
MRLGVVEVFLGAKSATILFITQGLSVVKSSCSERILHFLGQIKIAAGSHYQRKLKRKGLAEMTTTKRILLAIGIVVLIVSQGLMLLFFASLGGEARRVSQIRIACVGDSITEGSGYPSKLQILLGSDYQVGNFGVSGSSVLLDSDKPYLNQPAFQKSQVFQPSIVVIMLGTNDAREKTFESDEDFSVDYKKLIAAYQALEGDQSIWLVTPPPIFENDLNLNNTNLEDNVIPCIEQVADELNLPTIDVNAALTEYPEYFGDGVHPNSEAATLIAGEIGEALIVDEQPPYA